MSDNYRITVIVSEQTEGKNLATVASVELNIAGFSNNAMLGLLETQGRKLLNQAVREEYERRRSER